MGLTVSVPVSSDQLGPPNTNPELAGSFVLNAAIHALSCAGAERLGESQLALDELVDQRLTIRDGPERIHKHRSAVGRNERPRFRAIIANRYAAALALDRPKIVEVPSATV